MSTAVGVVFAIIAVGAAVVLAGLLAPPGRRAATAEGRVARTAQTWWLSAWGRLLRLFGRKLTVGAGYVCAGCLQEGPVGDGPTTEAALERAWLRATRSGWAITRSGNPVCPRCRIPRDQRWGEG